MNTGLGQQNLTGCATSEDLAQLLEEAFSSWHTVPRNSLECRETPRIPNRDFKPILLVSYAFDGPDVALNLPATIMDVSADGLGIILAQSLPVGAVACFAFNSRGNERHYDVAVVVRSAKCEKGYSIGLTFTGDAHSLDVESFSDEGRPTPPSFCVAWPGLRWLSEASAVAYRTLTQSNASHRTVDMDVYGKKAKLVIDVKLCRYTANLCVDGESIVRRSGVLRDRLRGLVSDEAVPTLIHLEGGCLTAWATVRPGAVIDCTLGFKVQVRQQICSRLRKIAMDTAPVMAERIVDEQPEPADPENPCTAAPGT